MFGTTEPRPARVGAPLVLLLAACAACEDSTGVNREPATVLWETASANGPRTRPLLIDSLVVFGTFDGRAAAYQRETGNIAWSRKLSDFVWGDEIRTAAGHVLVPEYELWALDPATGATRWRYGGPDGAAGVGEPAIAGDTLYLGSAGGWAIALDATTGQEIWTVDVEERAFRPTVAGELVIYGTRSFQGGNRGGPLGEGHVIALRRVNGSEAWRFPIPDSAGFPLSGGALNGGVVWQDRVVVGSRSSRVYALRLTDGSVLWEAAVGRSPPASSYDRRPTVLGQTVVALRSDGTVEGWDARTGELRWTRSASATTADPIVAQGAVYISASAMWILTEAGDVRWAWGDNSPSFAGAPAIDVEGRIFVWGTRRGTAPEVAIAFALDPPVKP